jgi:hypothetical protein
MDDMGRTKRRAPFDTPSVTVRVEPLEEPQPSAPIFGPPVEIATDERDRERDDDDAPAPPT